jgi:cytochrome c-type biogenesis protein CcmH
LATLRTFGAGVDVASTMFWTVATSMVVCATAALIVPLFWSERAPDERRRRRRQRLSLAGAVVGVPLVSLTLYSMWGSPQSIEIEPPEVAQAVPPLHPAAAAGTPAGQAGDLAAATARLEARLAENPADAAGWELLAQSYEFAGRTEDAARARAAAGDPARGAELVGVTATPSGQPAPGVPRNQREITAMQERVRQSPRDRDGWAALAELQRRQRDFPAALASFERRAALGGMTADLWADYADAHGASTGGLDATSARYIEAALRLDPKHVKALWLKASYQTAQPDPRSALATWQLLAALLPPDSPDARIIAANIAEARAAAATVAASGAGVRVSGEVSVDLRWRSRIPAGAALFIVAKAADEPGPPLAVYRTTVGKWPLSFRLDDSMSMLPTRRLSNHDSVIIEARVSASGRAEPQKGDLRAVSGTLNPRTHGPVRLVISDQIG